MGGALSHSGKQSVCGTALCNRSVSVQSNENRSKAAAVFYRVTGQNHELPTIKGLSSMRIAVIHVSVHHQNTLRIAEAMASAVGASLLTVTEARHFNDANWNLVGLGSGIFFSRHHPQLLDFASQYDFLPRHCFVFSTAGIRLLSPIWHRALVSTLTRRGVGILGQFCSPGWDTVGPLKYIGGIHRNRPNQRDLDNAAKFSQSMVRRLAAQANEIQGASGSVV